MTENEQPYEIPDDWQWIELKNICEYIRAGADKPQDFSPDKTELYTIPVVANSVQNQGIIGYTSMATEKANTVTVSARGTIGYAVLRKYDYYPIVRLIVIAVNDSANPAYIKYIFDFFKEDGIGSVIPQLTIPKLKNKLIPLPPLEEQHRIVKIIDSLFEKLDKARALAQEVVDGYELRRSKILHDAFTGKLTNSDLANWQNRKIKDIAKIKGGKRVPKGIPFSECKTAHPYIRVTDFENFTVNLNDLKYIDDDTYNLISRYTISQNDIYISIAGTIGKVGIIPQELEGANLTENAAKITNIIKDVDQRFLLWFLTSDLAKFQIKEYTKATTQPKLALFRFENVEISMPPIEEQREIARHLDNLLTKEQRIKELAEQTLQKIRLMKKTILARAFHGKL